MYNIIWILLTALVLCYAENYPTDPPLSIANISTTMDLLSIDLSDEAKMFGSKQSGLIFLHGLATPGAMTDMWNLIAGPALGLSLSRNKIITPKAPKVPVGILPSTMVPGLGSVRSWFNFCEMPEISVISPKATEDKEDLETAMKWVEEEIETMIEEGIPSENIVLAGSSQGGALTLYTALHTKYKIGGFIPNVAWQPLLKTEPPTSLPIPINKDTPIFHMNGIYDPIVPLICGWRTSAAFKQVFTQYNLKMVKGTHATSMSLREMYCWLKNNVPNMAFSTFHPFNLLPCNKADPCELECNGHPCNSDNTACDCQNGSSNSDCSDDPCSQNCNGWPCNSDNTACDCQNGSSQPDCSGVPDCLDTNCRNKRKKKKCIKWKKRGKCGKPKIAIWCKKTCNLC